MRSVRVNSISDLARLASHLSSLGQPVYLVRFKEGNEVVYGMFMIFKDYYNLYGVPVFYYCKSKEKREGNFILVKLDESGEKVEICNESRPGWLCIPIINLIRKPDFIEVE
ncbi:MAG: cren protein [Thermoprotei archaeon]|nr:MAG: cren protein [Thermoprotei archaeon]